MTQELTVLAIIIGIAHSGIRLATPYLYAALGEMMAQRSGVLNLGVEGIMLMGAFSAFYVVFETDNLMLGILAAIFVGALMGVLIPMTMLRTGRASFSASWHFCSTSTSLAASLSFLRTPSACRYMSPS